MSYRVETDYGDFVLRYAYCCEDDKSYYEVYKATQYDDECGYGEYVGDFYCNYDYDDKYEQDMFIDMLEDFIHQHDVDNYIPNPNTPYQQQVSIINKLESLVHNRFSVESLEKKLSEIFGGEKIHIELGYLDVEDDTASDWNYMFTSEQDVIGGDFDIYVLMHRNKDSSGNTMYVTEVGYEFFERAY